MQPDPGASPGRWLQCYAQRTLAAASSCRLFSCPAAVQHGSYGPMDTEMRMDRHHEHLKDRLTHAVNLHFIWSLIELWTALTPAC